VREPFAIETKLTVKHMKLVRTKPALSLLTLSATLMVSDAMPAKPPTTPPDIFAAVRSGDYRQLLTVLEAGASPNARDAAGNTPLMLAGVYADAACLGLLLDRGAEVNATNRAGATPLLRAATDYDKLKLLLDRGAVVNVRSVFGNTPLMLAARPANSQRAVELLLSRGADARATNNFGASALMAAAAGGDIGAAKALLKHGADANAQPGMDEAGFVFGGGRSALAWAAFRGDIPMIKLLVDSGADVNAEGFLGSPLTQATWADQVAAVRYLISQGARVDQVGQYPDYTALHWAASTEKDDGTLVKLLLKHGANPNLAGGERVEAFVGNVETPISLAQKRGETQVRKALLAAGAAAETPEEVEAPVPPQRSLPAKPGQDTLRTAVSQAIAPLQASSLISKQSFINHSTKQDCTSCHQQHLPLAAIGAAKQLQAVIDADAERQLVDMVGDPKFSEADWEALFHPDAVQTKGYMLFGWAGNQQPASEFTDAIVHHLAAIQTESGRWLNNLPRPPIESSDVGATALAIQALQKYPLRGRQAEFARRVEWAKEWLCEVKPTSNEERIYQLLGLAWAGESSGRLQPLAKALLNCQNADGGWSQLATLKSDAYATGQAVYALRVAAGLANDHASIERARRYLLETQLTDGTWFVQRRAFPFQPTMKSGFPHGRDSWISAAGTSWAVMALSLPDETIKPAAAGSQLAANKRD